MVTEILERAAKVAPGARLTGRFHLLQPLEKSSRRG